MAKPTPKHTQADILQVMTQLLSPIEGKHGMTTAEIATSLGVRKQKVQKMLQRLHDEGRLIRSNRAVECYDGSTRHTVAYLIKPAGDDDERDVKAGGH